MSSREPKFSHPRYPSSLKQHRAEFQVFAVPSAETCLHWILLSQHLRATNNQHCSYFGDFQTPFLKRGLNAGLLGGGKSPLTKSRCCRRKWLYATEIATSQMGNYRVLPERVYQYRMLPREPELNKIEFNAISKERDAEGVVPYMGAVLARNILSRTRYPSLHRNIEFFRVATPPVRGKHQPLPPLPPAKGDLQKCAVRIILSNFTNFRTKIPCLDCFGF